MLRRIGTSSLFLNKTKSFSQKGISGLRCFGSGADVLNKYAHLFQKSGVIEKMLPKHFDNTHLFQNYHDSLHFKNCDLQSITSGIVVPMFDLLGRGGKHWRPALSLMIAEAFGRDIHNYHQNQDVYLISALTELIHNASLVADDIEDKSTYRRSDLCIHLKYGEDTALNAANFIYFYPMKVLGAYLKKELMPALYEIYMNEMVLLHLGQNWDIQWHNSDYIPTQEQYLQMVMCKTGVLPRLSLAMVSSVLQLSKEQASAIIKFGECLGIGFQIKDDLLSIEGEEFAKKKGLFGEDIFEGKKTLMVIHSCHHSSPSGRNRLLQILRMKTKDPQLIQEAIEIMRSSDSILAAKKECQKVVESGWDTVKDMLPEGEIKYNLESLCNYLINRLL